MTMKVPDSQLSEYKAAIQERYGINISKEQLSQIFKELGITHKKVFSRRCGLILACERGCTARSRA